MRQELVCILVLHTNVVITVMKHVYMLLLTDGVKRLDRWSLYLTWQMHDGSYTPMPMMRLTIVEGVNPTKYLFHYILHVCSNDRFSQAGKSMK